ncbi:MAG TPA: ABC-2 family transporter protein [Candidatus Limiplasma sp.]|nr:ABC-2 family transporter protein [Candidatus Limiplasma sp.]
MMKKIKHYIAVGYWQLKLNTLCNLQYFSYTIVWFFMIGIAMFSTFFVLKAILDRVGQINGWNFAQISFLVGLSFISHGFEDMFFLQNRFIEHNVLEGTLDQYLIRPLNVFFLFNTAHFNLVGFYDILPGVIILVYACNQLHFPATPYHIIAIVVITVAGTFIRAAQLIITGSLAFWTKKSRILEDTNLTLMDRTSSYPLTMYPKWFQLMFTFLLPLGFITFYPVRGLLNITADSSLPVAPDLLIWAPLVALAFFLIARAVFNYGLSHKYESAGS